MILTYNVNYTGEHLHQLLEWCRVSCNLYNQTLYQIKQLLDSGSRLPSGYDLISTMQQVPNLEGTYNYRLLKAQCAQQCVLQAHAAYVMYFKQLKDWSRNKSK